jgi:hypothetical protein
MLYLSHDHFNSKNCHHFNSKTDSFFLYPSATKTKLLSLLFSLCQARFFHTKKLNQKFLSFLPLNFWSSYLNVKSKQIENGLVCVSICFDLYVFRFFLFVIRLEYD